MRLASKLNLLALVARLNQNRSITGIEELLEENTMKKAKPNTFAGRNVGRLKLAYWNVNVKSNLGEFIGLLNRKRIAAINQHPEAENHFYNHCVVSVERVGTTQYAEVTFKVTHLPLTFNEARHVAKGFKFLGTKEERITKELIMSLYIHSNKYVKEAFVKQLSVDRRTFTQYLTNYDGNVDTLLQELVTLNTKDRLNGIV